MIDSEETLLIGVDGGGTGCRVALGYLSTGVLCEAAGGAANVSTDLEGALQHIKDAVARAISELGLNLSVLQKVRAHVGVAGLMSQDVAQIMYDQLSYKNNVITDDRPTTVMGALDGADGLVAAIGTGTFLASRRDQDQSYIGGWGFHLADQGSGAWLARNTLSQALLCYDKVRAHTDLTRQILKQFNNNPVEISTFAAKASPAEFGSLCPMVVQAAEVGDEIAQELMNKGADYIVSGLNALDMRADEMLILTGGVGKYYTSYLQGRLSNSIQKPKNTTVQGAFKLALLEEQKYLEGTR